jgi:Glycosyl transferase family 2
MDDTNTVGLEHPSFGQFGRQLFSVSSRDLEACLEQQRRSGGRLGEILEHRQLLTREQIIRILANQARWVADARRGDVAPQAFPLPHFLSLCLPAYNEALNIRETLDAACAIVPAFVSRYEIVVVDDGSADDTAEIVRRYASDAPSVRLVRHEKNRGYGAALSSGFRAARGDLVAFTDADGQFSLLDLPQLLTRLNGYDAVIGYRYHRVDNAVRRFNAWAWNCLIRLVLQVQVRDLDCAFKLFRRDVVERLELTSTGAAINAEIMTQCTGAGCRILELPVCHYPRYHGSPTGGALSVIAKAFRELPRLRKYRTAAAVARTDAEPLRQ